MADEVLPDRQSLGIFGRIGLFYRQVISELNKGRLANSQSVDYIHRCRPCLRCIHYRRRLAP
jgi:hypothetical protein